MNTSNRRRQKILDNIALADERERERGGCSISNNNKEKCLGELLQQQKKRQRVRQEPKFLPNPKIFNSNLKIQITEQIDDKN